MSIKDTSTSKLITVRSRDRKNKAGTKSTNFEVYLGNSLDIHEVQRIVLRSAHFVNGFYNVVFDYNNLFAYSHNGNDYEFGISGGFYTIAEIMTELKTTMDAQLNPVVVTIDLNTNTNKLLFAFSAGNGYIKISENGSTISPTLGFLIESAPQPSVNGNRGVNLSGTTHFFLQSKVLSPGNNVDSKSNLDNTLIDVPVLCPFGSVCHYEPYDDELASINYDSPINISYIDISLIDEDDAPLNLNGYDIELVFKVYF